MTSSSLLHVTILLIIFEVAIALTSGSDSLQRDASLASTQTEFIAKKGSKIFRRLAPFTGSIALAEDTSSSGVNVFSAGQWTDILDTLTLILATKHKSRTAENGTVQPKLSAIARKLMKRIQSNRSIALPKFTGEFGEDLLMVVLFAYFLHEKHLLSSTIGCGNMSVFYWFSHNHTDDLTCRRKWSRQVENFKVADVSTLKISAIFDGSAAQAEWFTPPPVLQYYATHFPPLQTSRNYAAAPKQLAIINKYHEEWGKGPVNYWPPDVLETVVKEFSATCGSESRILYLNSDSLERGGNGISDDGQHPRQMYLPFPNGQPDVSWMREQEQVEVVQDFYSAWPDMSANEVKVRALVGTTCFLTVQGGAGVFSFLFGGTSFLLQDRGRESAKFYKSLVPKISGQEVYWYTKAEGQEMLRAFRRVMLGNGCSACSSRARG